jgi:hypothetical protein
MTLTEVSSLAAHNTRLLVRNAAHRLPLAEIKRQPWFLVDHKGDDARAL